MAVEKRAYPLAAASILSGWISLGDDLPDHSTNTVPVIRRCSIDTTGVLTITVGTGVDLMLNSKDDNSPDQDLVASRVWNAVWNDIADFQDIAHNEELVFGKCYYDTLDGAKICNEYMQKSVIGIASNTYGFGVGMNPNSPKVPIAVSGWVLAYVDRDYEPGTPLTSNTDGTLTEMKRDDVMRYPERIVAIYKRPETEKLWGPPGKQIEVNGRYWVKVK